MQKYSKETHPAHDSAHTIIPIGPHRERRARSLAEIRRRAGDMMLAVLMRPGAPMPPWSPELSQALDRLIERQEAQL